MQSVVAPTARGLFSDRLKWRGIHQDRLERYALGADVSSIAKVHHVRREAVHYSVRRSLARLPRSEATAILKQRWHARNDWRVASREVTRILRVLRLHR